MGSRQTTEQTSVRKRRRRISIALALGGLALLVGLVWSLESNQPSVPKSALQNTEATTSALPATSVEADVSPDPTSPPSTTTTSPPSPPSPSATVRTTTSVTRTAPLPLTNLPTLLGDITGPNVAKPRGTPEGWGFQIGAADHSKSSTEFLSYEAINVWGQVFATTTGSPTYDVMFHTRDPKIYFLRPSGWEQATYPKNTPGKVGGAYWRGDFVPAANTRATPQPDGEGGYQVSLQPLADETSQRDAFHFWWEGMYPRITIPRDTQGIVVKAQMKLSSNDGNKRAATAVFIASAGSDMYKSPNVDVDSSGINPAIPNSKMKYVTTNWQEFYASTLSVRQLRENPPPIG